MSLQDILSCVEQEMGFSASVVELGKIKIGGLGEERTTRGGKKWRLPKKLDHFIITGMHRNGRGDLIEDRELMEQLIEKYGDEDGRLRQIPVRVLSDDINDVLQSSFAWYGNRRCGARSDGRQVTWYYDPKTYEQYDPPKVEPWDNAMLHWTDKQGKKLFKTHTCLNVVVAGEAARWGGIYKFRTTSVISLRQLNSSLIHMYQLTGGILMSMPMRLVVRPIQVAPDGKATTVYVVHCELRGSELRELQQMALEFARYRLEFKDQLREVQSQYRRLLTGPGDEPEDEQSLVAQEYAPEQEAEDTTLSVEGDVLDDVSDGPIYDDDPLSDVDFDANVQRTLQEEVAEKSDG